MAFDHNVSDHGRFCWLPAIADAKKVSNGSGVVQYFAITAASKGDKDLGLQQLKTALRAPAGSLMLSYGALKLLPFWDPLRGHPHFEQIVASLAPEKVAQTAPN